MELNYFRDRLFDLLNDSEGMGIADLNADERNSLLLLRTNYQQSMKNKYRQRPLLQYNRNGNKSASAGGTF